MNSEMQKRATAFLAGAEAFCRTVEGPGVPIVKQIMTKSADKYDFIVDAVKDVMRDYPELALGGVGALGGLGASSLLKSDPAKGAVIGGGGGALLGALYRAARKKERQPTPPPGPVAGSGRTVYGPGIEVKPLQSPLRDIIDASNPLKDLGWVKRTPQEERELRNLIDLERKKGTLTGAVLGQWFKLDPFRGVVDYGKKEPMKWYHKLLSVPRRMTTGLDQFIEFNK